jgi:hypothetical protein
MQRIEAEDFLQLRMAELRRAGGSMHENVL